MKYFPGIFRGSSAKFPGFSKGFFTFTHPHSILRFSLKFFSVVGKPGFLPHDTRRVHTHLEGHNSQTFPDFLGKTDTFFPAQGAKDHIFPNPNEKVPKEYNQLHEGTTDLEIQLKT